MFRKTLISLAGAIVVLSSGVLRADDTDLYLNTDPPPPGSEPMVMFSIDYRPNLGSVVCRRGDAACDSLVDGGYLPDKGAGEAYDFFDIIRGSFGKVLDEVGGVRLGLMFNHDHRNNCEGPDGSTKAKCSNGGYIALGFTSMPSINLRDSTGQYVDAGGLPTTRKSCGPFQGAGVPEANSDRSYGTCTETTRQKIHEILWEIPVSEGDRTHSYQGKELFFELYRYLRGFHVYNGHTGFSSYDGNDGYDTNGDGVADLLPNPLPGDAPYPNPTNDIQRAENEEANNWNLDADPLHVTYDPAALTAAEQVAKRKHRYAWDTDIEQASADWHQYIEPFGNGLCSEVFTVNMMFQVSNQEDDSDPEIKKSEDDEGMGINKRNPTFVDVISKMREEDQSDIAGDQGVTSYFLLADPFVNNRTGGQYAVAGGTGAPLLLSDDPDELIANLTDIFKQILSVSTTFVAASIPVNSFNRAEVLDNVYLALFQPHPDKDPYWFGNVKKLRLEGLNSGNNVFLQDANGNPAIAADGRIRFDALTFWTDPTMYDVQAADQDLGEVVGKDGRSVNRGGGGHKQAGFGSGSPGATNGDTGARRILFDSTSSAFADLDATTTIAAVTKADFQQGQAAVTLTDDDVVKLIEWLRGRDVFDEDTDNDLDEGRRWYMASALHSRPIPINYGARGSYTKGNPEIVVAVGTNDGMMRLIRNTPSSHAGGPQTAATYGEELWAFAPRATMNTTEKLTRHYRGLANFGIQPPYGVDGAPVVYVEEDGDGTIQAGEKVWLFFGLRRGGRSYYAIDISDPDNPDLMWRIDGGSGDYAELGYTFSTPTVGRVKVSGSERPVLIFGGGYDFAYDAGSGPIAASMGNALFVVDAQTGTLIRKFTDTDMTDAIPSPVTGVDLNGDGLLDRIVVGDMGGQVWRMDLPAGSDPGDWTVNRVGSFGIRAGADGDGVDRRFFHAPDVVPFRDTTGDYDAVIIGSGNRANPKGTSIENYMFMVKDRAVSTINPPASGTLTPTKVGDLSDITNCTQASSCAATNLVNGWKYELEGGGEKSLSTPITLSGIVFFTTFIPPGSAIDPNADECVPPEGEGRLYAVGLAEGNALVNRDRPIDQQESSGDPEDRYEKLSSAGIPAEVVSLPPKFILRPDLTVQEYPGRQRWRTFWYAEEDAGQ